MNLAHKYQKVNGRIIERKYGSTYINGELTGQSFDEAVKDAENKMSPVVLWILLGIAVFCFAVMIAWSNWGEKRNSDDAPQSEKRINNVVRE